MMPLHLPTEVSDGVADDILCGKDAPALRDTDMLVRMIFG